MCWAWTNPTQGVTVSTCRVLGDMLCDGMEGYLWCVRWPHCVHMVCGVPSLLALYGSDLCAARSGEAQSRNELKRLRPGHAPPPPLASDTHTVGLQAKPLSSTSEECLRLACWLFEQAAI